MVLESAAATRRPIGGWRRFHPLTLLVGLVLQLHWGYLLLVDHVNSVPAPSQLVRVAVEVLQVRDRVPHLWVRSVEDARYSMEFPVSAAFAAAVRLPLQAAELDDLQGCMGYVLGVPMRWVQGERFRIWELHCGPVHRVYTEFRAAYQAAARDAERALEWHGGLILLLTLGVFVWEWRVLKRRERVA